MSPVIWVDGTLLAPDEPAVTALDRGLLLGYGVFETLAVESGVPFALTRHLERLEKSARHIGLSLPREKIAAGLDAVMARWIETAGPWQRGRLRLTVTGGSGALGMPDDDQPPPTVIVAISPAPPARKLGSAHGARAIISPWRTNPHSPLTGVKTISYAAHAVLQRYAREHGADEVLSATVSGHLCEGATSNVFVEINGELLTPSLASGCLPGVTRELILEWGAAAKLPVRVADFEELPLEILDDAAHLAITGSVRGIIPIVQMGQRQLEPGPLTEEIAAVFAENSALVVDP